MADLEYTCPVDGCSQSWTIDDATYPTPKEKLAYYKSTIEPAVHTHVLDIHNLVLPSKIRRDIPIKDQNLQPHAP